MKDISYIFYTRIARKSDMNRMEDLWLNLEGLPDDPAFAYFHANRDSMVVMSQTAPAVATPLRESTLKAAYPWASFNRAFKEYSLSLPDIESSRAKRNGRVMNRSDQYWFETMVSEAGELADAIVTAQIRDKAYIYEGTPIIKIFGKREDAHRVMSVVDSLREQFKEEYLTANPGTRSIVYPGGISSCGPAPAREAANVFWFGLPVELQDHKAVRKNLFGNNDYVSRGYGYVELTHGRHEYRMLLDEVLKRPARLTSMLRNIYFTDNNVHYRLERLSQQPKP